MTSRTGSKAAAGFTFIELVLVMTAIVILGMLSVPRFGASFSRWEGERAAADAAQLMRVAHAAAVTGSRTVDCVYEEDERRFVCGGRHSRPLPAGARVEIEPSSASDSVRFYPNGTSTGSTVVMTLMGAHVYHLAIDPVTSVVTLRAGRPAAG